MGKRNKYTVAVVLVTCAMVVILPLLAYLQYRWLGQISDQEFKRMQNNVRTAAFHCAMDLSQELTELMKSVGGVVSGSDDAVKKEISRRLNKWKMTTNHGRLILDSIAISSIPSIKQVILIKVDDKSSLFIFKDMSTLIIPIQDRPSSCVYINLNLSYLSTSLLPEIMCANFSEDAMLDYDIFVVDNHGKLFFRLPDAKFQTDISAADVVIPLLMLPPGPLSMIPTRPSRDLIDPKRNDRNYFFDRFTQEQGSRAGRMPPQEMMSPGDRRWESKWLGLFEIRIKHRDGSLETVVNNSRWRNLGVSVGVLLLLASSIVFLVISANRAQRLARQQLEFLAGISHELRTPLAVLKSAGENLADGVIHEKDRTRQYGDLIKKEVSRLYEMVEKALMFAGIQSGKRIYDLHSIDISTVIEETFVKMKKLIPSDNFKIETTIERNLPPVNGNPAALQSAFENLIINAIKYSNEEVWIGIDVYSVSYLKSPGVEIRIKDRGIGMSSADVSNVFKPFYRGSNAIEKQIEGSGLGLSITKHIIDAHKGSISVRSSLGYGSTFTVRLPVARENT
jgi:signal transduction histidine kinase